MPGPLAAPPMGVGVLVISHFFVVAAIRPGLATSAAHQWRIFADQRDARAPFLAIGGSGLRQRVLCLAQTAAGGSPFPAPHRANHGDGPTQGHGGVSSFSSHATRLRLLALAPRSLALHSFLGGGVAFVFLPHNFFGRLAQAHRACLSHTSRARWLQSESSPRQTGVSAARSSRRLH